MHDREKKIKVFVCGDHEFETKSYGISGASGKWYSVETSCTLCHIHWQVVCGVISQQVTWHLIPLLLFEVPLCHVPSAPCSLTSVRFKVVVLTTNRPNLLIPPGLHISLGIFFRLSTLLEDECHELDVTYSLRIQGSTAGSTFNTFTTALRRQSTLRYNINRLSTQVQGLTDSVLKSRD